MLPRRIGRDAQLRWKQTATSCPVKCRARVIRPSFRSCERLSGLRCGIVAGHSATLKGWSGPGAHLAGVNLQFAARTDEFGFDRVAAGPVDQFHRDARASSHPSVAPLGHRGDQWIEIKPFFREPILEATRVLFVHDAFKNSIMHKLMQTVRQPMRRQLQILLNRVEPPDAEEDIADD